MKGAVPAVAVVFLLVGAGILGYAVFKPKSISQVIGDPSPDTPKSHLIEVTVENNRELNTCVGVNIYTVKPGTDRTLRCQNSGLCSLAGGGTACNGVPEDISGNAVLVRGDDIAVECIPAVSNINSRDVATCRIWNLRIDGVKIGESTALFASVFDVSEGARRWVY